MQKKLASVFNSAQRRLWVWFCLSLFLVSCSQTVTGPPVTPEEKYQALVEILSVKWEEYLKDQKRVGDILYRLLLVIHDQDARTYPYVGIKIIDLTRLESAEKEALERLEGLSLPDKGYLVTYVTPYYETAGIHRFDILSSSLRPFQIEIGQKLHLVFADGRTIDVSPQVIHTKPVDFVIVDSEQINAWATPQNVIYVTTALCRILPEDDQLAAVVGHELAHLKRGHIQKRQTALVLRDIFGLVLGSLAGGSAQDIYRTTTNLALLKFSRDQEREADFFGLYYAYLAGFDLDKVARTWVYLGAVLPRIKGPNLLLTHPVTEERLARIRKIVRLIKEGKTFEDFMQTSR